MRRDVDDVAGATVYGFKPNSTSTEMKKLAQIAGASSATLMAARAQIGGGPQVLTPTRTRGIKQTHPKTMCANAYTDMIWCADDTPRETATPSRNSVIHGANASAIHISQERADVAAGRVGMKISLFVWQNPNNHAG